MVFQVWSQLTSGNRQFLAMATSGSQVGSRKFQGLETEVPCHLKSFLSGVYAGVIFYWLSVGGLGVRFEVNVSTKVLNVSALFGVPVF